MFYLNLAINNIKKSRQTYIPFGIMSIFMVSMLYIMVSISQSQGVQDYSSTLCIILMWGGVITGIFTVIFLFYINSFFMKKRKTEFGLYNVLGLNKFHISKVIFFEKLMLSLITISLGIILGIIFEKLLFLFLLNLIDIDISFGFNFVYQVVIIIVSFFLGLNFLMFLWDVFEVYKNKTIELLNSKKQGEKEPKVKIIWTLIGILCIGIGYYNAFTIENPIESMNRFVGSVIIVIIGTYSLFMAGIIAFLKFLKSRKNIYYKTNNFISISTMLYRMKKNATGLANICILSSAVIVAISTTLSLYVGSEKFFYDRYKGDINISFLGASRSEIEDFKKELETIDLKENSIVEKIAIEKYVNLDENKFKAADEGVLSDAMLIKVPISEFNKEMGSNIELKENSGLISYKDGFNYNELYIDDKKYNVKNIEDIGNLKFLDIMPTYIMIVNDAELKDDLLYNIYFNLNDSTKGISVLEKLREYIKTTDIRWIAQEKSTAREAFNTLYGGFLFIGILIGIVFLVATILIIYYKQISEGQDDKERFEIMKKVGLDDKEIKSIINKQTSIVFLSPVVVASIHLFFAYPAIQKMLYLLNLREDEVFRAVMIGTVLVFLIVYIIVYQLTSRVYYKIVK
ncbi:MAG: ABC transporter permease [Sarcina sp.]